MSAGFGLISVKTGDLERDPELRARVRRSILAGTRPQMHKATLDIIAKLDKEPTAKD